jgi:hypothetical protein
MDRARMQADFSGTIDAPESGWLLVRAWNDNAHPLVLDIYPYGTTGPVFFRAPSSTTHCGPDADYFLAWLDRLEQAASAHDGYNTPKERDLTLGEIKEAKEVFRQRR